MRFLIPWGDFIKKSGGAFTGPVTFQNTATFDHFTYFNQPMEADDIECERLTVNDIAEFYEHINLYDFLQIIWDASSAATPAIRIQAATAGGNYLGISTWTETPAFLGFFGMDRSGNNATIIANGAYDPFTTNVSGNPGNWKMGNGVRSAPPYQLLLAFSLSWS